MNRLSILYLLTGTRGGMNRITLLNLIKKETLNAHQIKEKMKLDYKTIQHHLRTLVKNRMIKMDSDKYGGTYSWTLEFTQHESIFNEILANLNKSRKEK